MYSKNFARFENVSPAPLNKDNKIPTRPLDAIPVKTYSDNSAIEAFQSLGKNHIITEQNQAYAIDNAENNNDNNIENSTKNDENAEIEEKNIDIKEQTNEKRKTFFGELAKISELIEGDWLIVALAILMLISSSGETNDKLTPIALLAIMFL